MTALQKHDIARLLIVDDEPCIHETLLDILEETPHQTECAVDGNDALEKMKRQSFDLIITDLRMPRMDGAALIHQIRQTNQEIALIVLSGQAELSEAYSLLKEYQISDFLPKPLEHSAQLLFSVENALEKQKLRQQRLRYADQLEQINTELNRSNCQLKQLHQQLEQKNDDLSSTNQQMIEELEQARITQRLLLPQQTPDLPGIRISTQYHPMDQIGGDLYDIFKLARQKIGILIADVTGHGVSAALISSMVSGLFKTFAPIHHSPGKTLQAINEALYGQLPHGKFTTAFYGTYEATTRTLTYSAAGHPPGYLIRSRNQEIIALNQYNLMLGAFPNEIAKFEEKTLSLAPGDKLFLYTDGIVEVCDAEDNLFGQKRLQEILKTYAQQPLDQLLDQVYRDTLTYSRESNFGDDVALFGLEILDEKSFAFSQKACSP